MLSLQNAWYSYDAESREMHFHHNLHQMIYVRRGELTAGVDDRTYQIDQPSVIFISRLEQHAMTVHGAGYERYTFNLHPDGGLLQEELQLSAIFTDRPAGFCHAVPVGHIADRLDILAPMICEEHDRHDPDFPQAADHLLESLLLLLFRSVPDAFPSVSRGNVSVVQKIRRCLEREPAKDVSLSSLAAQFHLNPYYMAHLFKEITGYSIKNYQLRCRVAAARVLLERSDCSMSEICARVGFSDMSSLSRYFHREVGMTPTQYRKIYRQGDGTLSH